MGLGGFPLVSLSEAREKAIEDRRIARNGGNPRFKPVTTVPTFAEATKQVHAIHAPTWKNDKQRAQWIDEVARIVWPTVGHLQMGSTSPLALACNSTFVYYLYSCSASFRAW